MWLYERINQWLAVRINECECGYMKELISH